MLKLNQEIKLFGIEYRVNSTLDDGYYLYGIVEHNDAIFTLLELDKDYLLEKFYNKFKIIANEGSFPEFSNLDDLSKFVEFIYTEVSIPTKDWKGKVLILDEGLSSKHGYIFETFNNIIYLCKDPSL